jgi:predicted metal-dependent HD superfamily phosphohydrolase
MLTLMPRSFSVKASLRANWLHNICGIGGTPNSELSDRLMAGWSQSHRAYHTLQHLAECLDLLELWGADNPARHEIAVALWFQDCVYELQAHDNEDRSIDAAGMSLTESGVGLATIGRVATLIKVTKHSAVRPVTDDEALMVDIDLAILGASPARFAQYCEQVRCEYASVPEDVYRARRAVFLDSMLARPRVFTSGAVATGDPGRESAARSNLAAESVRLQSV